MAIDKNTKILGSLQVHYR